MPITWLRSALDRGVQCEVFQAEWKNYGRAAGPKRNRKMLLSHPNAIVLAFPGGRGTANCVQQARELGMTVVEIAS